MIVSIINPAKNNAYKALDYVQILNNQYIKNINISLVYVFK